MQFSQRIHALVQAITANDGDASAAQFTSDGIYHDPVCGPWEGRDAIRELVEKHFIAAKNLIWYIHNPVSSKDVGYASYTCSWDSVETGGVQVYRPIIQGVCIVKLSSDGLFQHYSEAVDLGPSYVMSQFAPARIEKLHKRRAEQLSTCDAAAGHHPYLPWQENHPKSE